MFGISRICMTLAGNRVRPAKALMCQIGNQVRGTNYSASCSQSISAKSIRFSEYASRRKALFHIFSHSQTEIGISLCLELCLFFTRMVLFSFIFEFP